MVHKIRMGKSLRLLEFELCSGALDKHNREIYEGDMVKSAADQSIMRATEVTYRRGEFWIGKDLPLSSYGDGELLIVRRSHEKTKRV